MKVTVHVDGGARGNPGPAAAAAVVTGPEGEVLDTARRATQTWATVPYRPPTTVHGVTR